MWRKAQQTDVSWMQALLVDCLHSSMFLLGNLRNHGLTSKAEYGMRFWVQADRHGIFAISNGGTVMLQAPQATLADLAQAADLIRETPLSGVLGDAPQVRRFLAAAGLTRGKKQLDRDEPCFSLTLSDLHLDQRPDEQLVPLSAVPEDLVVAWRKTYQIEAIEEDAQTAQDTAEKQIAGFLESDSHRVLLRNDQPVAMTGFNMRLPEAVQVGGVFTPVEHRGNGYARRAVAYHLAEARSTGASRAVLFAASDSAAAAYRAIGFQRVGDYALVLFDPAHRPRTLSVEDCT